MKPRLLIPLTVQFSVRYVLRTGLLKKIREYANPVLVLGWKDPDLEDELVKSGVEYHYLPVKKIGVRYERLLKQLTLWHLAKINTPTTAIDQRRNGYQSSNTFRLRRKVRDSLYKLLVSNPLYFHFLLAQQKKMVWTNTNLREYSGLVSSIHPDIVFCLTPYFIEEELLLRAAVKEDIPIVTSILSFDNLTTRGILPIQFEEYYLWNQYNVEELKRIYPETMNKIVKIVGPPQFDFYYDPSYLWSEKQWRSTLGIPANRPVILFGSASKIIAPQEEQWLTHLDKAISEGEIHNNPVIILRRHPNEEIERWEKIRRNLKHVFFDEPWVGGKEKLGKTNITKLDIERLVSTLYYSQVHINASSTMTVDGAVFDRPQIGPAYDEEGTTDRFAQEIYLREHYLPITKSGGLEIVYSRQELIQTVNSAFQDPGKLSEGRKKLVNEICTFADGLCTARVNQALFEFITKNLLTGNK